MSWRGALNFNHLFVMSLKANFDEGVRQLQKATSYEEGGEVRRAAGHYLKGLQCLRNANDLAQRNLCAPSPRRIHFRRDPPP
jgi:hypothetical protein